MPLTSDVIHRPPASEASRTLLKCRVLGSTPGCRIRLWPRNQHLKWLCPLKWGDMEFEVGDNNNDDNPNHKSSNELKSPLHVWHYCECLACIHAFMPTIMLWSKYYDYLQLMDDKIELIDASDFPKVTEGTGTKAEASTQVLGSPCTFMQSLTPTGNVQQQGQECMASPSTRRLYPVPQRCWGKISSFQSEDPSQCPQSPELANPSLLFPLCFAAWDAFVMFNLYPLIIKWLHH